MSWMLSPAGSLASINDIIDVNISGLADEEILQWDSGTSRWVNVAASVLGLSNIVEDLTPELGGDLDALTLDITNASDIEALNLSFFESTRTHARKLTTDDSFWLSTNDGRNAAPVGMYFEYTTELGIYSDITVADPAIEATAVPFAFYTMYGDLGAPLLGYWGFVDAPEMEFQNSIRSANIQFKGTDAAGGTVLMVDSDPITGTTIHLGLVAGNYDFNITETVGAGQDNFVLTYDNGTGKIGLEAVSAGAEANDLTAAVVWADVPDANITEGSVVQHEAALTVTEAQVSDLGTYETADADIAKTDVAEVITAHWAIPSLINTQDGDYELVLTDASKTIHKASGGAGETITIPANASVAFPLGTLIAIENDGGGTLTVAITSDTLTWSQDNTTGSRTLADGGALVIQKMTATTWKCAGSQVS